jgi:hypothetical protein
MALALGLVGMASAADEDMVAEAGTTNLVMIRP